MIVNTDEEIERKQNIENITKGNKRERLMNRKKEKVKSSKWEWGEKRKLLRKTTRRMEMYRL